MNLLFNQFTDMMRLKFIMLQVFIITVFVGVLFSCSVINKQPTTDISHFVNDYKSDFYKYRFYKTDTCEALLIYIKSSNEGEVIRIQDLPRWNYECFLDERGNVSKSEVFGIYDKIPIFLINYLNSKDPRNWIKFDSILNINQPDRINGGNTKHKRGHSEYEPTLISYYYLNSSTKTLKLLNDSILNLKFTIARPRL